MPILSDMGTHMKTTIDLSDALFLSAKAYAQKRKVTLRALVEEGLRKVLRDATLVDAPGFKLKDLSVRGSTLPTMGPREWLQLEDDHVVARVMRSGM